MNWIISPKFAVASAPSAKIRAMSAVGAFLLILTVFAIPTTAQHTYYISSSIGNDSNTSTQAQSKLTPWAHLPCMANATGSAAAYKPVPGDQLILKGGDTWTNASFPCMWSWSGSNGNNIYIGADQTWFAGGSWVRPIWTGGGMPFSGTYDNFIRATGNAISFITLDNVEMTGFSWTVDNNYGNVAYVALAGVVVGSNNVTLSNLYMHGWTHPKILGTPGAGTCGSGCTDSLFIVLGDANPPYDSGSCLLNSIIDGSDSTNGGDSGVSVKSWACVKNSVIHDVGNGIIYQGAGEIGNNSIYNLHGYNGAGGGLGSGGLSFSGNHENFLENDGAAGAYTVYVHDNVIHDGSGEAFFMCSQSPASNNETDYVWNNIWYNLGGNEPEFEGTTPGCNLSFWNNTIVPQNTGVPCVHQTGSGGTFTLSVQNNHCITDNGTMTDSSKATANHNVVMTTSTAAAQGYTTNEAYVFSPTLDTNMTIGAGTQICGALLTCSGTLLAAINDTSYACTQQDIGGIVQSVCPARVALLRLPLAADAGAYIYSGQTSGNPPAAPQGLSATVN